MYNRPRFHYESHREMGHLINKYIGASEDTCFTMLAYDGPSLPSQIETVIAHRLKMSSYTIADMGVVEALRSLSINSFVVSEVARQFEVMATSSTKNCLQLLSSTQS